MSPLPPDPLAVARGVLRAEAEAVAALGARLDARFERAVEIVADCAGRVVVTGMGKSGFIARKISATLSSTGTPAMYLHPAEAVHGDLGGIVRGDVAIAVSYSGESEEIVRILPLLRDTASRLVAICGRTESSLARAADAVLDVSVPAEADPLGLAPTSSTTASLAMGDALAIAVSRRKGFTAEDFGRNHPAGMLGRRFLRASDLMHSGAGLPTVTPDMPMRVAIQEMAAKKLGMTCVVDGDRLVGVVSDGDLRRLLERVPNPLDIEVAAVMSRRPRTCPPGMLAYQALELMEAPPRSVTWLVVADEDGRPLGVLHIHDILQSGRA